MEQAARGNLRRVETVLLPHVRHDISKLAALMDVQPLDMWECSGPFRVAVGLV